MPGVVYRRASSRDSRNIDLIPHERANRIFRGRLALRERNDHRRRALVTSSLQRRLTAPAIGFHSDCVDAINALLITHHPRFDFDARSRYGSFRVRSNVTAILHCESL